MRRRIDHTATISPLTFRATGDVTPVPLPPAALLLAAGAGPDATDGLPLPSWFDFERSWWGARNEENVLMIHYADLKADLDGEMRRVADFLGIETPAALWPQLVEAAGFEAMQREGAGLLGRMAGAFRDGGAGFIHRGANGRWRNLYRAEDLALFDAAMARLPQDCARWLEAGRLGASACSNSQSRRTAGRRRRPRS